MLQSIARGFARQRPAATHLKTMRDVKDKFLKGRTKKEAKKEIHQFARTWEYPAELPLAQVRLAPSPLPPLLTSRIHSVFSKYKRADIYDRGNLYMKVYTQIHSSEKAGVLLPDRVPFQNSADFQLLHPELIFTPRRKPGLPPSVTSATKLAGASAPEDSVPQVPLKPDETRPSLIKKFTAKDRYAGFLEYDHNLVVAYLARKFPESYHISLRILKEIRQKFPAFRPKTVLDFGAGLAPSFWATEEVFPQTEAYVAVEPNPYMKKLGKYLTKEQPNLLWMDSILETRGLAFEKFDLIICSFVLEEVGSPQDRQLVVNSLYDRLEEGGKLVFVLPGTPMGFRFLTDLRNFVIEKPRDECNIVAPWPHHLACPLEREAKNFCRFEQSWNRYNRSVLPKTSRERDIIRSKFCYLVVRKDRTPQTPEECRTKEEQTLFWGRILAPIMKRGGHSILDLCNFQGQFERRTVARSHENKMWLRCTKRLHWGDSWWFPLPIRRKLKRDHFRYKPKNTKKRAPNGPGGN